MIQLCPFCGHNLPFPLKDGIANCKHCSRVFDSCPFNRMLSIGWLIRRKNYTDIYPLMSNGATEQEAELALSLVVDEEMSHEEYFKALRQKGVSELYSPSVD